MGKILKNLWVAAIALIIAISTATVVFGLAALPVDPMPPTTQGTSGGG